MKKVCLFILTVFLVLNFLYAYNKIDKLRMLKKFYKTEFSPENLIKERDKKLAEISNPVKGEFETTEMFNKRVANTEKQKSDIKEEYAQKIEYARKSFNERKEEIELEIQKLLNEFTEKVTSDFRLKGKYDADNRLFKIYLDKTNKTYDLIVPLSIARDFRENIDEVTATGVKKFNINEDWDYCNWSVKYKGKNYEFGTRSDITKLDNLNTSPKFPPDLEVVSVDFKDINEDMFLEGEEQGTLTIKIQNSGKGSAYGISATLKPSGNYNYLEYRDQRFIAEIKPDEIEEMEFTIYGNQNTPTQDCKFKIDFDESNGFFPDPVMCSFQTKKIEPPIFFVEKGIEDANGNYTIEQKEIVKVTARLANSGGDGKEVTLDVQKNSNNVFLTGNSKTRFAWDIVEKGYYKDVSFEFYTNKKIIDEIPLSLLVTADDYSRKFPLNLKIEQKEISPEEFVFTGDEDKEGESSIPGLTIDIEETIPKTNKENKYAIAVVIGNRNYNKNTVPAVEFAHRDAAYMKKYLTNTLGYRKGNIIYVNDATQADFNSIFGTKDNYQGRLHNYIKSGESDVFIYYSGHGAPDPQNKNGYFVPVDCDPSLVDLNGYSLNTFYNNLAKLDYNKLTVVIDACFSGASENGMLIKDISPIFIDVKNPVIDSKNTTVFTSSAGEQISCWYRDKKHSLFSYYFMKGLQGDANKNNDNLLTVAEMQDYINDNVPYYPRRYKNIEQTPKVMGDKSMTIVEYK